MKLKFNKEEFCAKYDELKSSRKMAEFFNTTKTTILRYAKIFDYDNNTNTTFKDEIGNRYGLLTVVERVQNDENGKAQYRCKCDCGNEAIVRGASLRSGNTTSCGCQKYKGSFDNKIDEIGNVYGKLTVVAEYSERSTSRQVKWICKCECGNTVIVQGNHLRSGHTQSCGCINSKGEEEISRFLSEHKIDFIGQYSFADLLSDKNGKLFFDFAILQNNILIALIEYDGIQHFQEISNTWAQTDSLEERQRRDFLKDEYCKQNNIPLLRIKYTDFNNITNILTQFLKNNKIYFI